MKKKTDTVYIGSLDWFGYQLRAVGKLRTGRWCRSLMFPVFVKKVSFLKKCHKLKKM